MTRAGVFLLSVICLVDVLSAFKVNRAFGLRTSSVLSANKLDGVTIAGDLTPIANNLLIKVKDAAVSTAGSLIRNSDLLFLIASYRSSVLWIIQDRKLASGKFYIMVILYLCRWLVYSR